MKNDKECLGALVAGQTLVTRSGMMAQLNEAGNCLLTHLNGDTIFGLPSNWIEWSILPEWAQRIPPTGVDCWVSMEGSPRVGGPMKRIMSFNGKYKALDHTEWFYAIPLTPADFIFLAET